MSAYRGSLCTPTFDCGENVRIPHGIARGWPKPGKEPRQDVDGAQAVETVAAWFQAHRGIELVSRDGSSEYAAAAFKGAPQATQVADRWHILQNLGKALKSLLTAHFTTYHRKRTQEADARKDLTFPQERSRRLYPQQAHLQQVRRDERLARYEQVMSLIKQGLTHCAIADQVGVGLTIIENWLRAGPFPERKPREQSSQLDPYRSYVQKRRAESYHNLMGIYRELQAQGYQGSYENAQVQFAIPSRKQEPSEARVPSLQRHCHPHGKPVGCFCAVLRHSLQRSKPQWPSYDNFIQNLIWLMSWPSSLFRCCVRALESNLIRG